MFSYFQTAYCCLASQELEKKVQTDEMTLFIKASRRADSTKIGIDPNWISRYIWKSNESNTDGSIRLATTDTS